MNIYEISQRIAQRPPFQMVEKVIELVPNESATGIKNVSVNEPYFMGHFPGATIMPGVLIVESCAQLDLSGGKSYCGGRLVGFDCTVMVIVTLHAKGALTFTTIPKESLGK